MVAFVSLPSQQDSYKLRHSDFIYVVGYIVSSAGQQIALIYSLRLLSSPIYAASHLVPRNLILLLVSTWGRSGVPLRGNWMQMTLVLAGGTAGIVLSDPGLVDKLGGVGARLRLGRGKSLSWHEDPERGQGGGSPTSPTTRWPRPHKMSLLPLLPLLFYLVQHPSATNSLSSACAYLPTSVRNTICHTSVAASARTVDLVIAYYDEDLGHAKEHIQYMRDVTFVKERWNRVVLYNKGPKTEKELRNSLGLKRSDEVIPLFNAGREGATYLKHIILHYNATVDALATSLDTSAAPTLGFVTGSRVMADHTFFLQPHLAWDWIAKPRIELVAPDTGFAHFGPMMRSNCGEDGRGTGSYPVFKDLYSIFRGEVCPPTGQLSAWSAQFVVSKRRIMANAYRRYEAFDELIEAPDGHWIHDMWGANGSGGQSNPAVGHSLERSWPIVFGCADPRIADQCDDDTHVKENCQVGRFCIIMESLWSLMLIMCAQCIDE